VTGPSTEKDATGNRRVDRLLAAARKHGWGVSHSILRYSNGPSSECWNLRPDPNPEGYTLTVYRGRNHSATVYADIPGNRDWSPISQRDALSLMFETRVTPPEGTVL
jgi:hypothetical protein